MRRLRTASSRRLAVVAAVAVALAVSAAVAQGALTNGGPVPSPKQLATAIHDAIAAPEPQGLTARIHFTNDLLPAGSLPGGRVSPLAAGADGRIWVQADGDLRAELQSDAGDAQIVVRGDRVTVYDASSNTVYRLALPKDAADAVHGPGRDEHGTLTVARIQRALDRLARTWTISGAQPTSTAGRPTYTVRISPRDDGGLLGAAEAAWDAVRGVPLRAAVYAQGQSDPVLELRATDVSYDAVPDADVDVAPPVGAKVVDLSPKVDAHPSHDTRAHPAIRRDGTPARQSRSMQRIGVVQHALPFVLRHPATLAGLPLRDVRLVTLDGEKAALSIYGKGLGAIAVLQHKSDAPAPPASGGHDRGGLEDLVLPKINIDGATGSELATALGTVVTFEHGGVSYVVAGSVPPVAAENAARGLAR